MEEGPSAQLPNLASEACVGINQETANLLPSLALCSEVVGGGEGIPGVEGLSQWVLNDTWLPNPREEGARLNPAGDSTRPGTGHMGKFPRGFSVLV